MSFVRTYEFDDKPAFIMKDDVTPFVLRSGRWIAEYDVEKWSTRAVPITEERFKEMAGDATSRMAEVSR